MQPSKEHEEAVGDPLDDLEELLDDDPKENRVREDSDRVSSSTNPDAATKRGTGGRFGSLSDWFSLRSFVFAVVVIGVSVVLGGIVPLIGGSIGHAAGVFVGAFVLGLAFSRGSYVEAGVAGVGVGAGSALMSVLGVGFLPIGIQYLQQWGITLLAIGGGIGLSLALLGHYFGRDLRDGLTGEIHT